MTQSGIWGWRVAVFVLLSFGMLPLFAVVRRSAEEPASARIQDWSTRHAIYSRTGNSTALEAARVDPRALLSWRASDQQRELALRQQRLRSFAIPPGIPRRRFPVSRTAPIGRDWSIYLGTAGTAPAMYPAKFSFDVNAAPSCANDFVVFPINAAGGTTQPNIVAFNNLYSGTAGGTGICNGRATPGGKTDTKTSATVLWSYNVSAIGGAVTTSPALSLDATGSKVAFVESLAGQAAHFHVLAWKSGDGQNSNLQNVLVPVQVASFNNASPAVGSGKATDLALGAAPDTLSSPYIDYTNDLAYVGNDAGVVFRIKNVFCTTSGCAGAAPTLDGTWGASGAKAIGGTCTGKLTAPVLNAVNSNVYVGCADGKLYSISQTGTVKSLVVGDGTASKAFGAIVDPPVVDSVNGYIYVVSGSANAGANAVLVQATADLSSSVAAPIGVGNQCNMHAPIPNNAYFTSITSSGALIYVGGLSTTGTVTGSCGGGSGGTAVPTLYGAGFSASGTMNTGTPTNTQLDNFGGLGREWAPFTEFFNTTTSTDWLFVSTLQSMQVNFAGLNTTSGFLTGFSLATEGVGTSGIIVDNNASATASPQAASIYFNALQENTTCSNNTNGGGTGGCAVKLTQATLQ